MDDKTKLFLIKLLHTFIWAFFASLVFYVLYAGLGGNITTFTWIAIATRKGYESPENPEEIVNNEFDVNMNKFLFNENDTKNAAQPIWWDGSKLRYDKIPDNIEENNN